MMDSIMELLHSYQNGNSLVHIFENGTKIRETDDDAFIPTIPESMDVKITNQCSLENYCKWCHEGSTKNGEHADLEALVGVFKGLPPGVELAIGGGNPLSHPNLAWFLKTLSEMGLIANITVNELHLSEYLPLLEQLIAERLVYGVGLTYSGKDMESLTRLNSLSDNVVYHMIAGVHDVDDLPKAPKALVLGYKKIRKGESFFSRSVEENLYRWYTKIPIYFGMVPVSFDNLALEQLNIRRFLPQSEWDKFYMGDDGTFTFYIDGVNMEYATSSTDMNRREINGRTAEELFTDIRGNSIRSAP